MKYHEYRDDVGPPEAWTVEKADEAATATSRLRGRFRGAGYMIISGYALAASSFLDILAKQPDSPATIATAIGGVVLAVGGSIELDRNGFQMSDAILNLEGAAYRAQLMSPDNRAAEIMRIEAGRIAREEG